MREIDLPSLANASGTDLVEFLNQNSVVIGEVTQHIANLERLKGTSQAHALGYQEYLPEDVNIEDMSHHLSKKGYDMSLESLSSVLLVAASAAIIAGIGIIAYRLIKASMAKEPRSVEVLEKQKQVQQMVHAMAKTSLTQLTPGTQEKLKQRFLQDAVKEVIAGMSDADLLNNTYAVYLRSEFVTAGATRAAVNAHRLGEQAVFVNQAMNHVARIQETIEAFRREFVDVVVKAVDITDPQMDVLIQGLKWNKFTPQDNAGIVEWLKANNLPIMGQVGSSLVSGLTLLQNKADIPSIKAYDPLAPGIDADPAAYKKFYGLMQSLKGTADYLKASKSELINDAKRSQHVKMLFKDQVDLALSLTENLGVIEQLVRLEADSVGRTLQYAQSAAKKQLNAIMEVVDAMEDKAEAQIIRDMIKAVSKDAGAGIKMRMESLEAVNPNNLYEVMACEGSNTFVEVLKVIGMILLFGVVINVVVSLVMSLMGVASMKSQWSGGISYMAANGKYLTGDEVARKLDDMAQNYSLSLQGISILCKAQEASPIPLSGQSMSMSLGTAATAISHTMAGFEAAVVTEGTVDQISAGMVKACDMSSHALDRSMEGLMGHLRRWGIVSAGDDSGMYKAYGKMQDNATRFETTWFLAVSTNDRPKITSSNMRTSWETPDKDLPVKIEKIGGKLQDELKRLSAKTKGIDKDALDGMSTDARNAHTDFEAKLRYYTAATAIFTRLIGKAMKEQVKAYGVVQLVLKTQAAPGAAMESLDDNEVADYGFQIAPEVHDPFWDTLSQIDIVDEMDPGEQVAMVTEKWGDVVKTGLLVAGVLLLFGVGFAILKRMAQGKRSENSATKIDFDKVFAGVKASDMLDAHRERMRQKTEDLDNAFSKTNFKFKDKTSSTDSSTGNKSNSGFGSDSSKANPTGPKIKDMGPVEVTGRTINPRANSAAQEAPEKGRDSPVVTLEKSIEALKVVDAELAGEVSEVTVRDNPTNATSGEASIGTGRPVPGTAASQWRQSPYEQYMRRMYTSMPSEVDREVFTGSRDARFEVCFDLLSSGKVQDLVDRYFKEIADPITKALIKSNHAACVKELEDMYDDIHVKSATLRADIETLMEDKDLQNVDTFKDFWEQRIPREEMEEFFSGAWSLKSIESPDKFARILKRMDEKRDAAHTATFKNAGNYENAITQKNIDAIRGSRSKAASCLLRLDELKGPFASCVRVLRDAMDVCELYIQACEKFLRMHRQAQRHEAALLRKRGDIVDDIVGSAERVTTGNDNVDKTVVDQVKEIQKEQQDIQDAFKKAGL
jgi:hypothetical protein